MLVLCAEAEEEPPVVDGPDAGVDWVALGAGAALEVGVICLIVTECSALVLVAVAVVAGWVRVEYAGIVGVALAVRGVAAADVCVELAGAEDVVAGEAVRVVLELGAPGAFAAAVTGLGLAAGLLAVLEPHALSTSPSRQTVRKPLYFRIEVIAASA